MSRVLPVPLKSDTYAFLAPEETAEGSDPQEKGVPEGNYCTQETPITPCVARDLPKDARKTEVDDSSWSFQDAVVACRTALALREDLPDGMAEELSDARAIYRETKDREGFAEDIKAVFEDWGFGWTR